MTIPVVLASVEPRLLAAVERRIASRAGIASVWGPAVGEVWDFLRTQPGLWVGGHNVFVYHQPEEVDGPLLCEFGVEVTRSFDDVGEVHASATPSGDAAVAVHRGSYDRLNEAYLAIERWMADHGRRSGGHVWEIYGDPTPDPADTETTVVHLLE